MTAHTATTRGGRFVRRVFRDASKALVDRWPYGRRATDSVARPMDTTKPAGA